MIVCHAVLMFSVTLQTRRGVGETHLFGESVVLLDEQDTLINLILTRKTASTSKGRSPCCAPVSLPTKRVGRRAGGWSGRRDVASRDWGEVPTKARHHQCHLARVEWVGSRC